jgi:hypothetical protein
VRLIYNMPGIISELEFKPSQYSSTANREVLIMENSLSLRLSASRSNLIKQKVEESHFALELKSDVFGQLRKMDFPYFSLSRDSFHV